MSVTPLGFTAIDHEIMKEVVVTGTFPYLWMHQNGAVEACHGIR